MSSESNLSLFVDESGTCGHGVTDKHDKRWVVAGIVGALTPDRIEALVHDAFQQVGRRYGLAESDRPRTYHMAEIRKSHAGDANQIAIDLLNCVTDGTGLRIVAVTNDRKAKLSGQDQTYAAMVMDLVALVETTWQFPTSLLELDVTLATRTFEGEPGPVAGSAEAASVALFRAAFEMGLASRGLTAMLGTASENRGLTFRAVPASQSWALAGADVAANTTFHGRSPVLRDALDDLSTRGRYLLFESLGSHLERRSRVCERDRDYGGAIYWMSQRAPNKRQAAEFDKRMVHLWHLSRSVNGSISVRAATEVVIERLNQQYRSTGDPAALGSYLDRTRRGLAMFVAQPENKDCTIALMRLQNYMLWCANHHGDSRTARAIIEQQTVLKADIAFSPDSLGVLSDYEFYKIEAAINELQFDDALRYAQKAARLVEDCHVAWQAVTDEETPASRRSPSWIRAFTTLARVQILVADHDDNATLMGAIERLCEVREVATSDRDLSRIRCHMIAAYVKLGLASEATATAQEICSSTQEPNAHDVAHVARAAAMLASVPGTADRRSTAEVYSWAKETLSRIRSQSADVQPLAELELADLAHVLKIGAPTHEQHLRAARNATRTCRAASPLDEWIRAAVRAYSTLTSGDAPADARSYLAEGDSPECVEMATRITMLAASRGCSLLEAIRWYTPI